MAKQILGVDIGYNSLKLVLMNGRQIKKTATAPMPNKLIRAGRVVSTETMGELIRSTMKANGMRCGNAAIVFPNETVFVRNVTMPRMTADQLAYNLPFEFRDYITDELKDYVFDYAMITTKEELETPPSEGETNGAMELLAAAAPVSLMDESRELLRKAGLKMVKAAPAVCSYQALIRDMEKTGRGFGEYCILDLGYQSIRMYMFKGDRHIVTRILEIGLSTLDEVIAEAYNVDVHLAHTYLLTNYEDCQNKQFCQNAYGNIAVEMMRALNFYRFSNPDSSLNDVWICGGGAMIEPLRAAIAETLDMTIHNGEELLPDGTGPEDGYALTQAVGITLE
ncbi:MAG: pilus assembly protein PilM [Oscillospiraceae bacterium]|nr:pilus assembly protein PilM [Oscillospiraceae bacterium]